MTKQKVLVILSPGFASDETDSTCLPAQQQLINEIGKQALLLHCIIIAFQYPFTDEIHQWNKATVIPLNGKNKAGFARMFTWYKAWRQLSTIKKQYELTGIFSFWYGECGLIGTLFGRIKKIKHCTWLLGQDARKDNRYVRLLKPKAEELAAISDFLLTEFEKNYGVRPAHYIPIGIQTNLFPVDDGAKDITVMGAGSLIPLKRFNVFMEVIAALAKKHPQIKAVICGSGAEKEKLAQMIQQNHLEDIVTLAGLQEHKTVLQMMHRTKLFLHTSEYEGLGVVCLEALYAGAQVISFCKPFNHDIQNWHIVSTMDEMIVTADTILSGDMHSEKVLPFTMEETAEKVLALFHQSETAVS